VWSGQDPFGTLAANVDALTILLFAVGLGLLLVGGELLVRGASALATAAGISPLVVGLTVVAFGTSAPELAVSVRAAVAGQGEIATGNVIGSNICNVLLILGISAVVCPLTVAAQLVRLDVPIMILAALAMLVASRDGVVSRAEGGMLLLGLVGYTTFLIHASRRESRQFKAQAIAQAEEKMVVEASAAADPAAQTALAAVRRKPGWLLQFALVVGGLACLVIGARWLVGGAVAFATMMGVSELVVGLTVVAVGTSLPEIATSIIASLRGLRDIAVGNIVGSNIFNVLGILGAAAVAAPVPVPPAARAFDLPVMVAVSIACLPIFFIGFRIARWEGAMFLAYYLAYTAYLIMATARHAALPMFGRVMLYYVIPLTAVTLGVLTVRTFRAPRTDR
jgi:cation:H+ antiporter